MEKLIVSPIIRCPDCTLRLGTEETNQMYCEYQASRKYKGKTVYVRYWFKGEMLVECPCGYKGTYVKDGQKWEVSVG